MAGSCPHFFKVILHDDLQKNHGLMVPRKFVRKYGSTLSNLVHLKIPSGDVWPVELERDDDGGGLFLGKGWDDFVDRCFIRFGYFLVFRYEGDSLFHVVVFDVSACEIDYPPESPCPANGQLISLPEVVVTRVDSSDDEYYDALSHDEGFEPYCPRPLKKLKTQAQARSPAPRTIRVDAGFTKGAASPGTARAIRRASTFPCKGPSAIVVVRSIERLSLPVSFMKRCFPGSVNFIDIKVRLSDGRTWMFRHCKERRPRFCGEWRKFIMDNNMRAGDVCVFELMEGIEALFRVVVFREEGVERPRLTPPRKRASSEDNATRNVASNNGSQSLDLKLEGGNEIGHGYPSFHTVISRRYAEIPLHIPKKFVDWHLKSIPGEVDVTLEHGGKSWPCKLQHDEQRTSLHGWQKFRRENGFIVGDTLQFELVHQGNELTLRVSRVKSSIYDLRPKPSF